MFSLVGFVCLEIIEKAVVKQQTRKLEQFKMKLQQKFFVGLERKKKKCKTSETKTKQKKYCEFVLEETKNAQRMFILQSREFTLKFCLLAKNFQNFRIPKKQRSQFCKTELFLIFFFWFILFVFLLSICLWHNSNTKYCPLSLSLQFFPHPLFHFSPSQSPSFLQHNIVQRK